MKILLVILPCLLLMFQPLNAKVVAPNYDFSIKTLKDFYPEKKINEIDSKYGKGEDIGKENDVQTLKYYVSHMKFKFPVIVHAKNGKVEDFLARLPDYFNHDIFFQSLINEIGKQNKYKKTGEEAFYIWTRDGLKHVYSAACTITCFPIFYSIKKIDSETVSVLEKMQKSLKN